MCLHVVSFNCSFVHNALIGSPNSSVVNETTNSVSGVVLSSAPSELTRVRIRRFSIPGKPTLTVDGVT